MLTEFQQAKIPNLFHMFDRDSNGKMEQADIVTIIDGCAGLRGWTKSSAEYDRFYQTFYGLWIGITTLADKSLNDSVELDEFMTFFDGIIQNEDNYDMIVTGISQAVFSTFDFDDDGTLSAEEFTTFYEVMGLDTTLASQIYGKMDLDTNGTITVEELINLVDQFFTSQDRAAPGNLFFGPLR